MDPIMGGELSKSTLLSPKSYFSNAIDNHTFPSPREILTTVPPVAFDIFTPNAHNPSLYS